MLTVEKNGLIKCGPISRRVRSDSDYLRHIDHIELKDSIYFIMFLEVPLSKVNSLYSSDNHPRYQDLISTFTKTYGFKPDFIARAPGRVDIIGGHLDYNDYPVLPIALQTDCLIACKTNSSQQVEVNHMEPDVYPSQVMPVHPEVKVEFKANHLKYFRAGYRAGVKGLDPEQLKGMQLLIGGNVPVAAGLSSSAAFTVCSALVSLHANGGDQGPYVQGSREQFLQRVITGELETGVAAGGMDQSISILGKLNTCLYIEFSPIKCRPVSLPPGLVYIVMNTLVEEVKLDNAPFHLNKRFCECRIAARFLGQRLGYPGIATTLKQIERWAKLNPETMSLAVSTLIDRHDYTQEELQALLGEPLHKVLQDIPLHDEVIGKNKYFRIWEAAKHILDEAGRLQQFVNVCQADLKPEVQHQLLGKIVRESMKSTQSLFDSSGPQSTEMARMALERGSLGTKITGAGWGGCTVSLVLESQAHDFIHRMVTDYYQKRPELQKKIQQIGIESIIFESKPGQGACLVTEID